MELSRTRLTASKTVLGALALVLVAQSASAAGPDWTQWGGPERNFVLDDPGIATRWSESGPPALWRRDLGDHGHSAIVAEGGILYTMFRRGDEDVVIAIDAEDGSTVWEQAYEAPVHEGYNLQFGPGPHSTPVLGEDLVVTVSSSLDVNAWDKATGERRWSRDLMDELEAPLMFRGYGSSPLLWRDLVILVAGGQGQGVVALRQSDGSLVWGALDARGGYPSPVLMTLDGVEQVVVALGVTRAGIDPATGEVLWELTVPEAAATMMGTPIQVGADLVFESQAYADGSRLLRVTRDDDGWAAEEVWASRKMRVMHGTVAPFDGLVYGSSGDFGPTFLSAVRLDDGELAFRQRGFAKANVSRVGDRVLILDEDGVLAVGDPSEEGIEILARADVLDGVSFTAPTLVGTMLFVRNRTEMVALDLSRGAAARAPSAAPTAATADVARPASGGDERMVSSGAAGVPQRTAGGQALEVPEAELEAGKVFHVLIGDGDDTQVVVTSRAPWQRVVALNSRVVGYLVAPFDLDRPEADGRPILSGALRIPAASFDTGGTAVTSMLIGGLFLDAANHPDLTVRFERARDVERLASEDGDGTDVFRYRMIAEAELGFRDRTVELEAPVELVYRNTSQASMNRYVGDLAQLQTRFDVALADLGIEIPPALRGRIAETLELDVFLTLTTVSPEVSLDPTRTEEMHQTESRFLTLLRDQANEAEAYRIGAEYVERFWDDAQVLNRMAYDLVAEPGVERRALGLALRSARRAVELTEGNDALLLNTLARIQAERGDVEEAIATQRRALELVDEQNPQYRPNLEANLARYEALVLPPSR